MIPSPAAKPVGLVPVSTCPASTSSPFHRSQTYDAYKEGFRHSWAGVSNMGEATGQPQEVIPKQAGMEDGLGLSQGFWEPFLYPLQLGDSEER